MMGIVVRHWNDRRYGDSKVAFPHAKTFLWKLCAISALALERFVSPALHQKKNWKNIGFKRRHISLRGAPTHFGPTLNNNYPYMCRPRVCLPVRYWNNTPRIFQRSHEPSSHRVQLLRGTRVNDTCADKPSVSHTMFGGKWNVRSGIRRSKKPLFITLAML